MEHLFESFFSNHVTKLKCWTLGHFDRRTSGTMDLNGVVAEVALGELQGEELRLDKQRQALAAAEAAVAAAEKRCLAQQQPEVLFGQKQLDV